MYKLFKTYYIVTAVVALVLFTSCKKFVQIDPPSTQLVTASVFNNDGAAHSALTTIYSQMSGESYNMSLLSGLFSDELVNTSEYIVPYQNALTNLTSSNFGPWNNLYSYIYQANAVMEGLKNYTGATPAIATQLTGEARFIRAFWYFYLVNCYGDVPLALTTDYNKNALLSRSPKADCYTQIVSDLKVAQGLLNTNYVNQTDTAISTDRIRPTKAAASALLARAYLYMGKYDSAEIAASAVIGDSRFSLVTNLSNAFLANSTEAIWQIGISQPDNGIQTQDGSSFVLLGAPTTDKATLNTFLLNSFEPGDQRQAKWINFYTSGITTWYYPYKYQVLDNAHNPNNRTEYTMMLRLAEQYLIRAEVRAMKNDFSGAASDLNVIRNRAGLPNYSGTMDQASIMDAILHERQVELFCEWGHRWFDLIRLNKIGSVMGAPGNVSQAKGGTWNPDNHQALYPIPQTEINNDPNLSQNVGY